MKRKLLALLLLISFVVTSCYKDEIDGLQKQVDQLKAELTSVEEKQQQALLDAIAEMQSALQSLESSTNQQYSDFMNGLNNLKDEVAINSNSVYYGNILTDADYDSLSKKGAHIITGKVLVRGENDLTKLAEIRMIGGGLTINGNASVDLSKLEAIGGDLVISGLTGGITVSLPNLNAVGGKLWVLENSGLTSVSASKLVFINDDLMVKENLTLTTLSLAKLDQVYEIEINEYNPNDPNYIGLGVLANIDLSSTNVTKGVDIQYIGKDGNLKLGEIGGSFTCAYTGLTSIEINATEIEGDFILQYNTKLETLGVSQLKKVNGTLHISFNDNSYEWSGEPLSGLVSMPAFDALEFIGGSVSVVGNNALLTLESFNSVTQVKGSTIEFSNNGSGLEVINVFNALTATGSTYTQADIFINERTNWFDAFKVLPKAKNISISIYQPTEDGGGIGIGATSIAGVAKVDGFNMLTTLSVLTLNLTEVTAFTAFPALSTFQNYSTYLTMYMPNDVNVGLCSMEPIFTKIKNGAFDTFPSRKAEFSFFYSSMDRDLAIEQLLSPCN